MGKIYADTDVSLARSGATTLAELEAFNVSMVLVPLLESANDHQKSNASIYEKNKDQKMLTEAQLESEGVSVLLSYAHFKKSSAPYQDNAKKQAVALNEIVQKVAAKCM